MKLKSTYFLSIFLFVMSCAPQADVTPEATVTLPPTKTPIPTPTLHPQFAALQEQISQSGRFTLTPDGTIQEQTADGGRQRIPGLIVSPNGTMTLTVNDETMTIDLADVNFDDENGISIDGYELDENGDWVEAMSEAMQAAEQHFDDLGYPTDGVEFVEGEVTVTGRVDGVKVFEMNIKSGEVMFDQNFAIEQASQQELMSTELEKYVMGSGDPVAKAYFVPLFMRTEKQFLEQFGHEIPYQVGLVRVMIDSNIFAWGTIILNPKDENAPRYLVYELGDGNVVGEGTLIIVPLMPEK